MEMAAEIVIPFCHGCGERMGEKETPWTEDKRDLVLIPYCFTCKEKPRNQRGKFCIICGITLEEDPLAHFVCKKHRAEREKLRNRYFGQ